MKIKEYVPLDKMEEILVRVDGKVITVDRVGVNVPCWRKDGGVEVTACHIDKGTWLSGAVRLEEAVLIGRAESENLARQRMLAMLTG